MGHGWNLKDGVNWSYLVKSSRNGYLMSGSAKTEGEAIADVFEKLNGDILHGLSGHEKMETLAEMKRYAGAVRAGDPQALSPFLGWPK